MCVCMTFLSMCILILNREGSELHIVVQDTGSSGKKAVQLEVNLVNVRPGASKGLLLHGRREHASRCETDVSLHNRLALTLASQFQRTSKGYAGDSLLRRSDAAKVEAILQRDRRELNASVTIARDDYSWRSLLVCFAPSWSLSVWRECPERKAFTYKRSRSVCCVLCLCHCDIKIHAMRRT